MDRFWEKVDKAGENGCWNWTAGVMTSGYGKFKYRKKVDGAHRVVMMLEGHEIPKGRCVTHDCDNKLCVNPAHLKIGTHADNMREARERIAFKDYTPRDQRGEKHNLTTLTAGQVRLIRAWYELPNITQNILAKTFRVSQGTISHIIHRRTWSHV